MMSHLHSLRLAALLLFLLGFVSVVSAQPPSDEFDFDEIPLDEGELPYIGVGGGYTLFLPLMNYDPLNAFSRNLGMGDFSGQLLMHGGGGWTVIGLIPNLRFGVYGAGGSKKITQGVAISGVDYDRTIRFDAGFTAAHIDYAIPIFRSFSAVPGVMIGSGNNTLKVVQTQRTGATMDNFFGGFVGGSDNRQATMTRSFLFLYPAVNLEYALTQFAMIRVGGGYQYSYFGSSSAWTDTEGIEIAEGTTILANDIKSDGPMLNVGLFLGLFQQ
jgi:hypothetical protein